VLQGREYLKKEKEDHTPQPVTIRLPAACHVYSVRDGKYLGQRKEIETAIEPAVAQLYALLPWRVVSVEAGNLRKEYRCGEKVECEISVRTSPAAKAIHVVHVEVLSPNGKPYKEYSRNMSCAGGKGLTSFRLALNDPVGKWKVILTDVATGTRGEREFAVKR
jgi:hypothetical protein